MSITYSLMTESRINLQLGNGLQISHTISTGHDALVTSILLTNNLYSCALRSKFSHTTHNFVQTLTSLSMHTRHEFVFPVPLVASNGFSNLIYIPLKVFAGFTVNWHFVGSFRWLYWFYSFERASTVRLDPRYRSPYYCSQQWFMKVVIIDLYGFYVSVTHDASAP